MIGQMAFIEPMCSSLGHVTRVRGIFARALRAVSARDAATAFDARPSGRAVSRCGTSAITGAITGVD
jgi:hypothetical protein